MSSLPSSYSLPDLHQLCPWKALLNPHYHVAAAASSDWVLHHLHNVVESGGKPQFWKEEYSELLCAYGYPYAEAEKLRTCCDFINLLFAIDEVSDHQGGKDAKSTAATVLNAMKDEAYDDGTVLCKMAKEYVQLLPCITSKSEFQF